MIFNSTKMAACKRQSFFRQFFLHVLFVVGFVCYAAAQTTEPYNWNSVAIGGGGFVSAIITSKEEPGLMYARTDVGGAYRWDKANNKWIPLMDWASDQQQGMLGVESVAIDPQNPNIVYMLAGISYFNNGKTFILRSTDYGANFTITEVTFQFKAHGNGMGRQNGEKLEVDPNNSSVLFCGTRRNGLFKSTNSGATWSAAGNIPSTVTVTHNDNGISFVLLDKSSVSGGVTQKIFAGISRVGNDQNFYKSDDGGATFTAVVNPNLAPGLMPQRGKLSGDGHLYITYANGAGPHGGVEGEPLDKGEIWKYNIASGAWTNVSPNLNRAYSGISVDPANPMRLVASTINTYSAQGSAWGDRFFLSTNGGTSWTDIIESRGFTMDPDGITWISTSSIHWAGSIEFDPSNTNRVLVTSGNGIFINEDINTSKIWKFNVRGLEETVPLNFISIPGGPAISVIGDYDGFRHTDVTQYAPIHNPRVGTTTGLDYAVANTKKVVRVGGDKKMFYSNDMGVTWTETSVINGTRGHVAVSANGNTILHCPDGTATNSTYKSTNNGSTWTTASGLNISNVRPVADGVNSNKFYVYDTSSGNVYVSTNGGSNFTVGGNAGASNGAKIIRTVPGKEGHIWVALYNGGLSRSTNSGTSFTKLTAVTQCGAVGIGKAAPGSNYETVYIYGTVNGILGIHRSTDEGVTWVRVNDDNHEYGGPANGQFIVGDMNVYGRVYMSTAGRGIVYGETLPTRMIVFSTPQISVDENSIGGVIVGTITASPTETNLHNWVILSGNENNAFSINSTTGTITVAAGALLDYETTPTYTLTIGGLDNLNLKVQGSVTITLNDINEAPTDLALSKSTIVQNNLIGAVVGTLSTTDEDVNSTFTYTLVSGTGDTDNAAFTISGAALKAAIIFNYTTKSSYSIRVKTTDNGDLSFEKQLIINIDKVDGLPVTNFTVKAFNEICSESNNGKITIAAAEPLNYRAVLSGPGTADLPFTSTLEIPVLIAGTYTLCITAEGLANYKQCYDLVITEPQPLSVYSSVNVSDKSLVLNLAGASSYQITLNGKSFTTTSNSVKLDMESGANDLKVSTDKYCQGVFNKSFFLEDGKRVYPNPFNDILNVSMGNDLSRKVQVSLYSLSGALVYSKEHLVDNSAIQLELSALNSGTYIMKIITEFTQNHSKIIKK